MSTDGVKHIGQLTPDPKNARQHNPRNIGMIVDSLQKVGGARSIVIDEDDVILAGNGVIEAAAEAGIESVRVIEASGHEIIAVRRRGLTEEQKTLLKYYDNRTSELADWDAAQIVADLEADVDLSELWSDAEIAELVAGVMEEPPEAPEPQIDRAEELREKWQTARGQVWEIGKHRLMCGDSTSKDDVAKLMGDDRPLLMVTDPPYGVEYDPTWRGEAGINKNVGKMGLVTNDGRVDWREAWALFTGDVVYCWHAGRYASAVQESLEAVGFSIVAQVIWNKDRFALSRGDYHWKHEPCWYAVRDGAKHHWAGARDQSTVWDVARADDSGHGHGTQKPLECMARPIRNHEGDVYDPLLGSGTTMVAAEQTGRICYGMEIYPPYIAVTLQRLADMGLEPKLVN